MPLSSIMGYCSSNDQYLNVRVQEGPNRQTILQLFQNPAICCSSLRVAFVGLGPGVESSSVVGSYGIGLGLRQSLAACGGGRDACYKLILVRLGRRVVCKSVRSSIAKPFLPNELFKKGSD